MGARKPSAVSASTTSNTNALPKKNQSAFFHYTTSVRSTVKSSNPNLTFTKIAKIIADNFKSLVGEERKHWDEVAKKDLERFRRETMVYERSLALSGRVRLPLLLLCIVCVKLLVLLLDTQLKI